MKGVGNHTVSESLIFGHWVIVLQLLKVGLPWEAINNFTHKEIALILGIQSALNEEEHANMEQSSQTRNMHRQMQKIGGH